jgi:hypothetical protein
MAIITIRETIIHRKPTSQQNIKPVIKPIGSAGFINRLSYVYQ